MPTWPVHLKIAHKLKDKYNLTDDFIIGNVIPDTMNGYVIDNPSNIFHHSVTHYSSSEYKDFLEINIDKFLEENKEKLNNEIILGTYMHLITDYMFNTYTQKNHFEKIDGEIYAVLNDGTIERNIRPMEVKQSDFKIFGDKLINKKEIGERVSITKETLELIKDLNYKVEKEDVLKTVDKINEYVESNPTEEDYRMFTEKEFNDLFNNCYEKLEEIIYEITDDKEIKKAFENYTKKYDMEDDDISYKYYHSYRVMNHAKYLANKLNLSKEDKHLASIIGLYHDIGRFEQDKLFDSYVDTKEFDHGDYGEEVLLKQGIIKDIPVEEKYYNLIGKAVRNHNKYSIEDNLNEQELIHAKLIRDADKLDIIDYMAKKKFRKKSFDYDDTAFEIRESIKEEFFERKPIFIKNKPKKTNSEKAIIMIALMFDLNYKETAEYVIDNNILEDLYNVLPSKENYKEYINLAKKHLKEMIKC